MTQLPTPVVQTEFGGLVAPFIDGLRAAGAALDLEANVDARGQQKTEMEHKVDMARAEGVRFDAKLEDGKKRVLLDGMKIEYTKAVDEERRGMLAILANSDEQEKARYLREHPFLSRENQAYAMALHGQQIAGMDINGAQSAVMKHFAEGGDASGISVSDLMDSALQQREAMPNEALIAYQGQFIPQVRGMIKSQKTKAATKRQSSLEDRAKITTDTQINMVINGDSDWESVLPQWQKEKGLHPVDSQPSDLELYKRAGVQFGYSLPNFAGRYDEATAAWESMPAAMQEANPQIPRQIKKASDQYELIKHNKLATRWKEEFRATGVNADYNSVALMENMRASLPEAILNDPHTMRVIDAIMKTARDKNEDTLGYIADRISGESADLLANGDVRRSFGVQYTGENTYEALREVKNTRGVDAAVNHVTGTENSQAAISLVYAETREQASQLSKAFMNGRLRERLGPWMDYLHGEVSEVGDPGNDHIFRLEGKQSIPSRAQIENFKQQIVIRAALKFADNDTQDADALIKAEYSQATNHGWGDAHVEVDGKALRDTWIDSTGNASRRHANPRAWWGQSSAAEAFEASVESGAQSVRAKATGARPNYHGQFQWADDHTYTPIVGSDGVVAFNKWDPSGHNRPEQITPDHENWGVINDHFEAVVPEAQRVKNGDYHWGKHFPSQYIKSNDEQLFPGGESGGYWERGLKPVIQASWLRDNPGETHVPQDVPPPPGAPPEVIEAWKEDVREFLVYQGDILEGLGWQREIDDPNPQPAGPAQPASAGHVPSLNLSGL